MNNYVRNFLKYRHFLFELIKKDYKFKYRRSRLGVLWSLLNPLLMITVLSIVFSTLFKHDIPHYILYLLTGKLIFDFFSESTSTAMRAINGNASLIRKIYVPKYIFPMSKTFFSLINLFFTLIILFVIMLFSNIEWSWEMLLFPLPLIYVFIFSLGGGLFLSAYAVYFKDLNHLYGVVLTAWMYLTPIIYPVEIIPDKFRMIMDYNPLYYYVSLFRDIIYYGNASDFNTHAICIVISLLSLLIGLFVFRKKQNDFILYL
ncbi:ABC transporter permease [Paenibacillus provencensis]|uniref:Transport permease protein n=1 Tax=Paenibacillus provencensis TaxID=441151 RepID=A0ABW3PT59_9BACL|nr:ABC transporter permease [Paenibacillus sp. MER 78]